MPQVTGVWPAEDYGTYCKIKTFRKYRSDWATQIHSNVSQC